MTDLFNLSLGDIAPDSITGDQQVSSLITALDPELQEISRASLEPLIMARIDELPEHVIDLLAWQMHVDFYDLAGTLDMKRKAVKGSILWHMHKGTEWAILEALRMIDIEAEFVPWYVDGGEPYTFKLRAIVSGDFYRTQGKDKLQASIRRAVFEAKSTRSLLAGLETTIHFQEDMGLYAGVIPLLSGEQRILLPKPEGIAPSHVYSGVVSVTSGEQIIRPHQELEHECRIYAGVINLANITQDIGVDYELMQELLRQFEARIFARLDESEHKLLNLIAANHSDVNAKLEEIREMLRWQGDNSEEM